MKKFVKLIFIFIAVACFALLITENTQSSVEAKNSPKKTKCTTIQSGGITTSDGRVITTGFDEWGYNYQARMFNGKYCDAYRDAAWCQPYKEDNLLMKWNDAWLSNMDCNGDGKLDRHYGFGSYIGSGAWLTNHMSGEYEGENYHWDISGDWVIHVNNGAYAHDYTFAMVSLQDGTFEGLGGYPAGSDPYTIDEMVINGKIDDDNISFTAVYYANSSPTGYSWSATGVIDGNGDMSGTGTSGVYQWESVEGKAQKIYETCYWNYFTKIVAAPKDAVKVGGEWHIDGVVIGPVIWGEFATIQEVYNDPCEGYEGLLYKGEAPTGFGFYKL
jgi:hypothetical protein